MAESGFRSLTAQTEIRSMTLGHRRRRGGGERGGGRGWWGKRGEEGGRGGKGGGVGGERICETNYGLQLDCCNILQTFPFLIFKGSVLQDI